MTILVVDDDAAFRASLSETLQDLGYAVFEAASTRLALHYLRGARADLAIVDLRMPGEDGLVFLRDAKALAPDMPCVMLTAYASGGNTIAAMGLGAFDHLTKPLGREQLRELLARAIPPPSPRDTPAAAPEPANGDELMGASEAMREVFKRIGQAAASEATVMILGETGTGKEMVARALHLNSARAHKPFIAVNCAAIPADLLESELFGHVKGAFSGAHSDRLGRFREAEGGTLLLDEIGDMSLTTQAKILRALQEREVCPVGGQRSVKLDVRLLAATHHDLPVSVREGRFREDLWYRLQVISIVLPPLRERSGDVLQLAEHFLRTHAAGEPPKRLSREAARHLLSHHWPGNVRELRNAMQRACVMTRGPWVEVSALDLHAPVQADAVELDWNGSLNDVVAAVEKRMILSALERTGNNRADAARQLGLSRQQLYRKLEQLGIGGPSCPPG